MAHDQIHEQLNAIVKGDGGVIGITENEGALRRWTIAGPEVSRMLSEINTKHFSKHDHHNEQISSIQSKFATDVRNAFRCMQRNG